MDHIDLTNLSSHDPERVCMMIPAHCVLPGDLLLTPTGFHEVTEVGGDRRVTVIAMSSLVRVVDPQQEVIVEALGW